MVIPDVNLLIYAHDLRAQFHARAKIWWEDQPLSTEQAQGYVADWLACPTATVLTEGPAHWTLFARVMKESGVSGALISDDVLATFAIEYRADLHSNDLDFGRFSGFRWVNPLTQDT